MEQFSHDLTIALEETSRSGGGVGSGRWGFRRRTRSTGNLPCAPQPTEDSSSSAADVMINLNEECDEPINAILSDSDDRQELKLVLSSRLLGNFESDSLNENFSPARPNTRRKRKFKRMAVEYETTPSTPGYNQPTTAAPAAAAATVAASSSAVVFPASSSAVKKRTIKQSMYSQDHFRSNVFFCGKRKRSHRSYYDHNEHKLHSSSVPRQRDLFTPKNSYADYRNRRCYVKQPCERILPLNKSIISKIEKISKETKNKLTTDDGCDMVDCTNTIIDCDDIDNVNIESTTSTGIPQTGGYQFAYIPIQKASDDGKICGGADVGGSGSSNNNAALYPKPGDRNLFYSGITYSPAAAATTPIGGAAQVTTSTSTSSSSSLKIPKKSDSFESTFGIQQFLQLSGGTSEDTSAIKSKLLIDDHKKVFHSSQNPHHQHHHPHPHHQYHHNHHHHNHHQSDDVRKTNAFSKKLRKKMQQLQFDDPNAMECSSSGTNNRFNEFLSSSSLSSSDSEAGETNESDREGDDELTDWPGNEAMVNFTSKNDFKRARPRFILPTNAVVSAVNHPPALSTGIRNSSTIKLPQINSDEFGQDDDTLMSADELNTPIFGSQIPLEQSQPQPQPPNTLNLTLKYLPATTTAITGTTVTQTADHQRSSSILNDVTQQTITQSIPIDIHNQNNNNNNTTIINSPFVAAAGVESVGNETVGQMPSETTTNPNFLSSAVNEVRELRAGVRRVHEDRPGFTILTSVNEQLAKFLQANTQSQLKLPDTDEHEHEKLIQFAKLYSLNMIVENGCAILTKTSNTTQSVSIDPRGFPGKFSIDFKRRCYDNDV